MKQVFIVMISAAAGVIVSKLVDRKIWPHQEQLTAYKNDVDDDICRTVSVRVKSVDGSSGAELFSKYCRDLLAKGYDVLRH